MSGGLRDTHPPGGLASTVQHVLAAVARAIARASLTSAPLATTMGDVPAVDELRASARTSRRPSLPSPPRRSVTPSSRPDRGKNGARRAA